MIITELKLKNFRCFENFSTNFCPGINIIYGQNAIGKTSILESVYCLGITKSCRTNDIKDTIKKDTDHSFISGIFKDKIKNNEVSMFSNHLYRTINYNHSKVRKASEFLGTINVVEFDANDFLMFKESNYERRKLFDVIICQISKKYTDLSINYKKLIKSRNALLKRLYLENRSTDADVLAALNTQIVDCGEQLINLRGRFINKLNEYVAKVHNLISESKELLQIKYVPNVAKDELKSALVNSFHNDVEKCRTTVGPHLDNFIFLINDKDVSKYGSQGQQRNTILSIKLAMADLIGETTGNNPIVLLDDVFSELDHNRQNALIKCLNPNYQHIITTASIAELDEEQLMNANLIRLG